MRRAAKRDATEPAILDALRHVGAQYLLLGPIDVLVLFRGTLTLLDCKTKQGRWTKTQQELVAKGWPVQFVTTAEQALIAIGAQ